MLQKQYQHDGLGFQRYRAQQYKADSPTQWRSQVTTPTAHSLPNRLPSRAEVQTQGRDKSALSLEGRSQMTFFFIFTYCHLSRANDLQTQRLFLFWRKTFTVDFLVSSPCKSIPVLQGHAPLRGACQQARRGHGQGRAQSGRHRFTLATAKSYAFVRHVLWDWSVGHLFLERSEGKTKTKATLSTALPQGAAPPEPSPRHLSLTLSQHCLHGLLQTQTALKIPTGSNVPRAWDRALREHPPAQESLPGAFLEGVFEAHPLPSCPQTLACPAPSPLHTLCALLPRDTASQVETKS